MKVNWREMRAAYLFLLPFLLTLAVFFVYATIRAIYFSFTDYNLFNVPSWVGLRNYANLFRSELFVTALRNTVVFAVVVTFSQTFLALVFASVLNAKIRGLTFFRTAFYLPSITSSVVITLIFLWMYQRRGLINYLATLAVSYAPVIFTFLALVVVLQVLQVLWEKRQQLPVSWFDPALLVSAMLIGAVITGVLNVTGLVTARAVPPVDFTWLQTRQELPEGAPFALRAPVPLIAIMIQNVFTTVPTFMLMYLAALQDVPKSHYEAAAIDGANPVQQFWYITIPSVQPITFLVVTLGLIGTLQVFDQIAIFGDSTPLIARVSLAYFVYNRMFPGGQAPEVGFASAAAMFLALFTLLIVLGQRLFLRSEAR
jgi:multiple sugar transport system permease protein